MRTDVVRDALRSTVLAGSLLVAAWRPARADTRAWTLCTAGALRSCHGISIETIAILSGGQRVGTAVTIALTNLQGSGLSGTSDTPSGLYQVTFFGPAGAGIPTSVATQSATMSGPGASGTLTWRRVTTTFEVGGGYLDLDLLGTNGATNGLLGGCAGGTTTIGPITARTCGTEARAVFAFTFDGIVDASGFDDVYIAAYGSAGGVSCGSHPAGAPFFQQPCDVLVDPLATAVVPEPLTVVLLGTGLFGLGAARRRPRTG